MLQLGKTIVSEEIIEKDFVCNLASCKGQCCIEGEAGAPLLKEETKILDDIYPILKPYLREEGIKEIEDQGTWITSDFGDLETPLVNGAECVYVIFDDKGNASCAVEKAYNDGLVDWKKPVSCHLYPIRVQDYSEFSAVNYNRWDICDDACSLGSELKVPVYKFVKEGLVRRFGQNWYDELSKLATKNDEANK